MEKTARKSPAYAMDAVREDDNGDDRRTDRQRRTDGQPDTTNHHPEPRERASKKSQEAGETGGEGQGRADGEEAEGEGREGERQGEGPTT